MIDIKFRAWDEVLKKYVYFDKDNIIDGYGSEMIEFSIPDSDWEQYTGLKDKNGKEIYEKDILKANTKKGESILTVEWVDHSGYMGYRLYGLNRRFNCAFQRNNIFNMNLEIIGNINQTPELLEVIK